MAQEATGTPHAILVKRFAVTATILVMFLWGVGGVILVGGRYVGDLQGTQRKAEEILDYDVFYAAGRLVLDGRGEKLYDLQTIGDEERKVLNTPVEGKDIYPYLNPPFVAAIMAPFSLLPPVAFGLLLVILDVALMVLTGRAMLKQLSLRRSYQLWLFWLAYFSGFSVFTLLWHGQFTPIILTSWFGFVSFQMRGKEGLSGASLALALIKPQFVLLPLAFLIFHRRWDALRTFFTIAAGLAVISVGVSGPEVVIDYPRYVLSSTDWSDNGIFGQYMLGWQGFLADVTGDNTPSRALFLALALPTVALTVWTWRGVWKDQLARLPLVMATTFMATLLVTPHLYLQDLLLGSLALGLAGMHSVRKTGSIGPWGILGIVFWVAQMPRSFFYFSNLPVTTLCTFALFLLLVWRLRQDNSRAVVALPAKRIAA
jgi:Glycosyltransferase family 87